MTAILDYQLASEHPTVPSPDNIQVWADCVLEKLQQPDMEFTVRIVDEKEGQALNRDYRQKDYPTNVLSFPFEAPPCFEKDIETDGIEINFLGDLVVCAAVVDKEAREQNKQCFDHWAHMIVHGILHLLGYDHIDQDEAKQMETLEVEILSKLGIDDPY